MLHLNQNLLLTEAIRPTGSNVGICIVRKPTGGFRLIVPLAVKEFGDEIFEPASTGIKVGLPVPDILEELGPKFFTPFLLFVLQTCLPAVVVYPEKPFDLVRKLIEFVHGNPANAQPLRQPLREFIARDGGNVPIFAQGSHLHLNRRIPFSRRPRSRGPASSQKS